MINEDHLVDLSYLLDYQIPDNRYYWRARGGNRSDWTDWSETRRITFDTQNPRGCRAISPDSAGLVFQMHWTYAYDPPPASGIAAFAVYVRDGASGNWHLWLDDFRLGYFAIFTGGQSGHTYYFAASAIDGAGNYEEFDSVPECSTYVDTVFGGPLYNYLPGDVNMYNGQWPPSVIGADATYLVNYFRGISADPACPLDGLFCAADVNGDCAVIGSDVTRLVNYFRGVGLIECCLDYMPRWPNASLLPPVPPEDWPGCQ